MPRFLLRWLAMAASLWLTQYLLDAVSISVPVGLLVSAAVLSFVNGWIRPVVVLLTLPATVVTLGLFYLVVNGLMFMLAAMLVPGFTVSSLWGGICGAFLNGLIGWFLDPGED